MSSQTFVHLFCHITIFVTPVGFYYFHSVIDDTHPQTWSIVDILRARYYFY